MGFNSASKGYPVLQLPKFHVRITKYGAKVLYIVSVVCLWTGDSFQVTTMIQTTDCPSQVRGKVKVKVTLVQALRLCTGLTAHKGSRGIALPFHDHGSIKGVRGQRHAPATLYPQERPGTHCTGGWVGPRAGLDRCGKSHPHRDLIPIPSSP